MKQLARSGFLLALGFVASAGADPLFDDRASFSIDIHGPLRTIERSDDKEIEWPGTLHVDGQVFDIELSQRGNHRLRNCRYPPLRIDFDKDQLGDTVFEHQNDIKLVVQCKGSNTYVDYLRTEYLIYEALLMLTPMAYRVRWVDVVWTDVERDDTREAPAFFVERKSRVADRRLVDKTDVKSVHPRRLEEDQAALVSLFAWLISNADFSIIDGPEDEECCHNAKLLVDGAGRYYPLIYDFDNSGLVDATYAEPTPEVGVYVVTQRKYRGFCMHNDAVRRARDDMLAQAEPIAALFEDDPILRSRQKTKIRRFLDRGFEVLRDTDDFEKEIIGWCRG